MVPQLQRGRDFVMRPDAVAYPGEANGSTALPWRMDSCIRGLDVGSLSLSNGALSLSPTPHLHTLCPLALALPLTLKPFRR